MAASDDWVAVGRVTAAQGYRGAVRVLPLCDDPQARFSSLERVFIDAAGGYRPLRVVGVHFLRGLVVVTFKEVGDLATAEGLRGRVLLEPLSEVPPLPPGRYYHFQLEGLPVYDEGGALLGEVREVLSTGSNDVWVVQRHAAAGELLLPALKDVVRQVDLEGGRIVVRLLPGLLD